MARIEINTTKPVIPVCYAYTTPGVTYHNGWTKIGFTERDPDARIKEQTQTAGIKYNLHWAKNATYERSNDTFTDKEFHGYLNRLNIERQDGTEWFKIEPDKAKNYFYEFRENRGLDLTSKKAIPYKLRREQEEAVSKTMEYFENHPNAEFLWNAKPRFGKTLSTYDLCKKMGFINILIVTNRPAIANSWYEDYEKFIGLDSGYYFVSSVDALKNNPNVYTRKEYQDILKFKGDQVEGCIQFVSLQDIKGSIYFGGTINKLSELSNSKNEFGKSVGINWDILVIDEAHEGVDTYKTDRAFNNISRKYTLHLSGTPFKALANEKFPDNAIYNWTYADEQKEKNNWNSSSEEENPYQALPKLNLFTYQMSNIIREKIEEGINLDGETEEYAFDLNEFFATNENGRFKYNKDVDKFLDALATGEKFPFSTPELRDELKHTFWILNRVDSAKALGKKLQQHPTFKEYKIIIAAGDGKLDDIEKSEESYDKVVKAIKDYEKTITISVGQLTTGITIPEWTGILMLSNMKSPALYMQAAFRCQNPCLTKELEGFRRKTNAYVFDFDPARTLTIFEEFANDLYSETSGGKGDFEKRKKQVRELLNFFPVYGEDEDGEMVELDAEKVLTIPRRIHAVEVVNRGFMSNFLFANIGNIFSAPQEITDIINNFKPVQEGKFKNMELDNEISENLSLDENNEVLIPDEKIIGKSNEIFGGKIYQRVEDEIEDCISMVKENENEDLTDLDKVKENFSKPLVETIVGVTKEVYNNNISKSIERRIGNDIRAIADKVITEEIGQWEIEKNKLQINKKEEIEKAATGFEVSQIEEKYQQKENKKRDEALQILKEKLQSEDLFQEVTKEAIRTVETDNLNREKNTIEDETRDRLRGFARTIPSFLMAYGNQDTTLESFDKIVPEKVFKEVTGITLDQFRFLRDGGKYIVENTGEEKHFEGHLFDEVVFNDSVKEFLNKKNELSNYFEESSKMDIFDYIPPQKTNQIFTPKKVVKEMVDMLEKEDPGCFDDPNKTFIDLYMKSGLYIAEIVKRLYRSEKMKEIYSNDEERLNHIFSKQVYGLAPTEIIYQIVLNFVMGFNKEIQISNHNLRKLDSLEYIKNGNLEEKLEEIF